MTVKKLLQLTIFLACTHSFAQLGVGTSLPNSSAQLDVVSTDKGILIPRLALASTTDTSTIANGNIESLMVYNTNTAAGLSPGYYYWANNVWNRLALQEEITSLPQNVTSTNGSITGIANDAALAAMDLEVNVDDTTIEVDATNGVQIKDDGITTAKILDDNVTISKIGAVVGDANKVLGTDATGNAEWQDAATIAASLGENVTSTNGSITGVANDASLVAMDLEVKVDDATIEVDATNGVQIKDNGVTTAKIADDAVIITKIGTAGVSDANKTLTTDVNGDPQWETVSIYIVGEIKQTIGSMPAGWIKLEGQAISSLTASQQTQATSLGLSGNLPNATNAYLSQNGTALGSLSGSNAKTIAQNNLPNVALSGSTNTAGSHVHFISGNASDDLSASGISGDYVLQNNDGSGTGENTNAAGNHSHTFTTSSINGGVAQQPFDITPNTLSVETYIYLGE
ncbi:hypothetical protein HME9304_02777 [Flagellimonas maritima]|uniref:Phage tail collar domain-containing protein n=1 Tax=Flagellimonas maritima TaxID=1383885 RepID=A0A2Z4LWJ7_9FLAO|nr:hypothetical protein [Allomuricauda aurantiaca]AWX45748.1 hypothetical protein HME9304_02777 [Allomuricauda aurantiaca]